MNETTAVVDNSAPAPQTDAPAPRIITEHQVNECNDALQIHVLDGPGPGGAPHCYAIVKTAPGLPDETLCTINFQNGPIAEVGTNGATHEALLAIVVDRLRAFQSGPYACRENALALTKIEEGQLWLQARTRTRLKRGVEGTSKK